MKSKFLKKLFAIVLALSVLAVPSLSLAATTTLSDISFAAVADGSYDDASALNAAITAAGKTGAFSENGVAANYTVSGDWVTIARDGNTGSTITEVEFSGISTGVITFKYAVEHGTRNDKYFTINGTKIVGTGNKNAGYYLTKANNSFPFETIAGITGTDAWGNTYYKSSEIYVITLDVVAYRADASSTWDIKGYHGSTLVFQGTLPASPITKFGIEYGYPTSETLKVKTISATHISIEPAELEDATDLEPLDDPKVIFGEAIADVPGATVVLKKLDGGVPTGEAIASKLTWSTDGTELTVTPLTFLEEGASYQIAFTGMTGDSSGISYDNALTFTTKATEYLSLSAPVSLSYKDGENNAATIDAANKVQATATIPNISGATREIGGIIGIYYPAGHTLAGKLKKVEVVPFATSTDVSIPFSATYDAGEVTDFTSVVEAFVLNRTSDGIMAIE